MEVLENTTLKAFRVLLRYVESNSGELNFHLGEYKEKKVAFKWFVTQVPFYMDNNGPESSVCVTLAYQFSADRK